MPPRRAPKTTKKISLFKEKSIFNLPIFMTHFLSSFLILCFDIDNVIIKTRFTTI